MELVVLVVAQVLEVDNVEGEGPEGAELKEWSDSGPGRQHVLVGPPPVGTAASAGNASWSLVTPGQPFRQLGQLDLPERGVLWKNRCKSRGLE